MAQQQKMKPSLYGQKLFLLPAKERRLATFTRMIKAAGGQVVDNPNAATVVIKDGSPPKKKGKGAPIKNASWLYQIIVSDPFK